MMCTERSQHIQDQWERKEGGKDQRSDHRNLVSYMPCLLRNNIFEFRKSWNYLELQRTGPKESGREHRTGVWGWTGNGKNPRYLGRIQSLAEKNI